MHCDALVGVLCAFPSSHETVTPSRCCAGANTHMLPDHYLNDAKILCNFLREKCNSAFTPGSLYMAAVVHKIGIWLCSMCCPQRSKRGQVSSVTVPRLLHCALRHFQQPGRARKLGGRCVSPSSQVQWRNVRISRLTVPLACPAGACAPKPLWGWCAFPAATVQWRPAGIACTQIMPVRAAPTQL